MVKLILKKYNDNQSPININISEITTDYVVLTATRTKNDFKFQIPLQKEYSTSIKLNFVENVTALAINDYVDHKTRFFAITNGRPSDITSNEEFEIFKDYNNSLLYKEYVPKIIFIKNNKDIYIYSGYDISVDESINCETILEISNKDSNYSSIDDLIRSISIEEMPEEAKMNYYKFRRIYDHENNNFYGSLSTYSTPINSYIDLELDFLLNYIKFLYESGDTKLLEFLNSNAKYQKIFDICLSENKNTVENKTEESITKAFNIKNFIQTEIKKHNKNLEKINSSKNEEELKNIIDFPQKWALF